MIDLHKVQRFLAGDKTTLLWARQLCHCPVEAGLHQGKHAFAPRSLRLLCRFLMCLQDG